MRHSLMAATVHPLSCTDLLFQIALGTSASMVPMDLSYWGETNKKEVRGMNYSPCHCSWIWSQGCNSSSPSSKIHSEFLSPSEVTSSDVGSLAGCATYLPEVPEPLIVILLLRSALLHMSVQLSWGQGIPGGPRLDLLGSVHIPPCYRYVKAAWPPSADQDQLPLPVKLSPLLAGPWHKKSNVPCSNL